MITKTLKDKNNIILSIHESVGNGYVIHLADNGIDEPYDTMAYSLDYEDIDEIINQLTIVKDLIGKKNGTKIL
jgi:hypothetical protein